MTNHDRLRQSMLSVPKRWGELYFAIFGILCAVGETFVIYYAIVSRQPDESALDVAADILLRLAAVPIVAALLAYLIMRGRDLAMKTWETFRRERFESGVEVGVKRGREEGIEEGREEGREDLAREMLAFLDRQAPGEGVDALYDFLSKIGKNGDNGSDKKERGE